ncbi:BMC domain-containing protein [Proteocatella sphenisci]|uniref:BMC domain-containing protein n=1 Tax=Proteocatella sphenisci TaxID=181070 RepID=UPI00048B5EB1|nr:BMC domain-containing protein [Proteocatella sphenisci]
MKNTNFSAIGVVEINFFTNALIVLDEMLKASDVHLVSSEKKLGGRMVTIIVGGDTSSVNAAVEAALAMGDRVGEENIKVAVTISNPHPEIKRLLNAVDRPRESKQEAATDVNAEAADKVSDDNVKQTNQTQKPKTRRTKS